MAALKQKKRQLFRTQALKFFVGAFGDNSAPTLLFAWPRYMGAIVIACCLVLSLIWLGFAERPLRLTVSGQLTPISTSSYCFTATHRNLDFNTIKVGQTGVLLIKKEAVRVKTASFACPTNALPLRLERQIELSDQKVQLSLTIGYEPFWSFMI